MSLDGPEALEHKSVRWEKMIHSGNLEDIIRQEIKWKRNGKEISVEFNGKSRSMKKILVNEIVIPSPWNSAHAIVFCFINCVLLIDSVYEVYISEYHFREASHCSTGLVNWTSWTGWSFWYSMVPMWMPGMRYYEIVSFLNHKKFSLNFIQLWERMQGHNQDFEIHGSMVPRKKSWPANKFWRILLKKSSRKRNGALECWFWSLIWLKPRIFQGSAPWTPAKGPGP